VIVICDLTPSVIHKNKCEQHFDDGTTKKTTFVTEYNCLMIRIFHKILFSRIYVAAGLFFLLAVNETFPQEKTRFEPYDPVRVKYKLTLALNNAITEPEASLSVINKAIIEIEKARDWKMLFEAETVKANYYIANQQFDEALIAANHAYLIAVETKSDVNRLNAYCLLSQIHLDKNIREEMLEYLYKGLTLSKQLFDTTSISFFLVTIPDVEVELGNVSRAMEYSLQAIDFFQSFNDSVNIAKSHVSLGVIHSNLGNFPSAKKNFFTALEIFRSLNDSLSIGRTLVTLSGVYINEYDLIEAERYCLLALRTLENTDIKEFFNAKSLLAEIMMSKRNFIQAEQLIVEVERFQNQVGDIRGLPLTLIRKGELFLHNNHIQKSIEAFNSALSHAVLSGSTKQMQQAYLGLSKAHARLFDYSSAFKNLNQYVQLTDSLYNLKKVSEAAKLEQKVEQEKQEKLIEKKELELERNKVFISKQRHNQVLLLLILALSIAIIIFSYREYRHKKEANKLLSVQKDILEKKKRFAEKQTRDFTDSLNYAKRIQQAILRASLKFKEFFSESFLLFLPREIVSGDFYWFKEKNGRLLFAVADCTGHGVPGAFMSIIGTYGLNRIVSELNISNPGDVLNKVNEFFGDSLEQREGAEIFDGMDIAFCNYNPVNKELSYSGANIPIFISRRIGLPPAASNIATKNQSHILYQIRPNKQPVGSYFEEVSFITHSIKLLEGDIVYIFSDGFADQFGGPDGKKFRITELRKLICNLADTPLDKQKKVLERTFNDWKGKKSQVDDVSIIGMKV